MIKKMSGFLGYSLSFIKNNMAFILCVALFTIGPAFASSTPTLSGVSSNIQSTVKSIGAILMNVAIIAGIGFIFASMFKFRAHNLNPTQVPLSQGITLLMIGGGLTMFPLLVQLPGSTWLGTGGVQKVGPSLSILS